MIHISQDQAPILFLCAYALVIALILWGVKVLSVRGSHLIVRIRQHPIWFVLCLIGAILSIKFGLSALDNIIVVNPPALPLPQLQDGPQSP